MEKTIPTKDQVVEKIREVLVGFQVTPEDVKAEAEFEALGLDSLDLVEMAVKVEDVYGIDIEEDDLATVKTVGDAAGLVLTKLGA